MQLREVNIYFILYIYTHRKEIYNPRKNRSNGIYFFEYRNTCRGLFEQHKLLFSFHMCVKILNAQGKIIPGEYAFLLRGGIVLDRENQPDKPVSWLPDETWDNITELDKLPGFHGLVSSFEQLPRDWHNWCVQRRGRVTSLLCYVFTGLHLLRFFFLWN